MTGAALIGLAVALAGLIQIVRRETRHRADVVSTEPISHVRPLGVGVDRHSRLCIDGEGREFCVCGLTPPDPDPETVELGGGR